MGYRIVKITPAMAEVYLETNTNNRAVREYHVEYLTQVMLADEWRLIGEPIRFSGKLDKKNLPGDKTVLLDGQHRLIAFIESERKTLEIEIIDELPANSFQYMDQGRPRSAADVLTIEGYKNTNVLASVGRGLILFEKGGPKSYWSSRLGGKRKVTNHNVLLFIRKHEKEVLFAIKQATHHMSKISMSFSCHSTLYYLFRRKSIIDCEKFYYHLGTGEKLTKTNPISYLRSILIDHSISRQKARRFNIHTRDLMVINIIAWNAWREKKKLSSRKSLLTFDKDTIPKTIR